MKYVLDTNVVSALFRGRKDIKEKMEKAIISEDELFISAITYYEIKRGLLDIKAKAQLKKFDAFCKKIPILYLSDQFLFDRAATIWIVLKHRGALISDADILIGSTMFRENHIDNESITIVSDDDHFDRIPGLIRENWVHS